MTKIANAFYQNAKHTPNKDAIICDGQVVTYGELSTYVTKWSQSFTSNGVKEGDHVGVLLPNSIEFAALVIVAAKIGVVLVPLNTSLPVKAVKKAFIVSDVRHVVSNGAILDQLFSSTVDFSFVRGVWVAVDQEIHGAKQLSSLLLEVTGQDLGKECDNEDSPYILTMTSGSTGDPKPIVLTQRTKFNRAKASVQLYGVSSKDVVLAATPLYHSLAERLVLLPLLQGGTSIIMTRFSPSEWLQIVSEYRVTFTIAVSSQLVQIEKALDSNTSVSIDSLRCLVSSSALLELSVKSALTKKLGCEFHECYGASEIAIATNLDSLSGKEHLNSVGKAAPGVDIKIVRDDGSVADSGEIGEIACKTPMIFGGYYKLPELTSCSMWKKEYFKTGDMGKLDEDGYLYFCGRKKEVIITGGINVYPLDIESALLKHSSVKECAAIPVADEKLGEVVAVAIVPVDSDNFNLRRIKFHCAELLADYQLPRKYFVIDELPKNGMGKVMKHALVNEIEEQCIEK